MIDVEASVVKSPGKPRYLDFSKDKKRDFLEKLANCWSPTAAARSVGMTREMVFKHREGDAAFAKQWDDAIEQSVDTLEDQAINRAMNRSDTLMIFMLKALRPHKYGDKLNVTNNVNITVQKAREELAGVPKEQLLASLAALEAPTIDSEAGETSQDE